MSEEQLKSVGVERIEPESPARLRDCLTALAEQAGKDVHRCEVCATDSGVRVIITSSRKESEEVIALHLGRILERLFNAGGNDAQGE